MFNKYITRNSDKDSDDFEPEKLTTDAFNKHKTTGANKQELADIFK